MEQKAVAPSFNASLLGKEGTPPTPGKILKITPIGFLLQINGTTGLLLGGTANVQFTLPDSSQEMVEQVKVMKTYLRYADPNAAVKVQMIEFHFTQISSQRRSQISSFNDKYAAPKESKE